MKAEVSEMALYQYVFKNDYDKSFKVKDKEFFCYSKRALRQMYFDASDYKIVGETLKKPKDADGIVGTLDMGGNTTLDIFMRGTHKRRFYTREGYICVARHTYVCLLRKSFFF